MASVVRWSIRGLVLIALIAAGQQVVAAVASWLDISLMPHSEDMLHRSIVAGTVAYVILLALPFVPGAEIGLTLLTVLGGPIAPLVYLATALGLTVSYAVGRLIPAAILGRGLARLGLTRAARLAEDAAEMRYDDFQESLARSQAPKFLRSLFRFRYVALVLLINMPGNVVFGGGGGIALMAGLSRAFAPLPFLLSVLIAVLPVPLLFYIGQV